MDWSRVKGLTLPNNLSVKKVECNGVTLWEKSAPVVTYLPILPDDTDKYPMYLKGWAKYTANRVTSTASSGTVGVIDTEVRGAHPSTCYSSVYDGCENTKSLSGQPDKSVKYGYTTDTYRDRVYIKDTDITPTDTAWNAYLAEHPVDILFELETSDDSLWFAVTDGTSYGYYCPASGEFVEVYGMTGTVIERCEYVQGDNDAYGTTDYHLRGDDTLKIKFQVGSSASNIGGCFVSSTASDNFCLYAGNGAKWYMRYDGGNNRNYTPDDSWQELEATPTGAYVNGTKVETWTQASFTSRNPMYIGYLYASSSPKIRGKIAYFEVAGKHKYLPVKVGSTYLMMDVLGWAIAEQHGEWSGGAVIAEAIPFPTSIYEDPVTLMMGGNPFSPEPDPEPEPEEGYSPAEYEGTREGVDD